MSNPLHELNTLPSEQVEQLVAPLVAGDAPVCSVCKQPIQRYRNPHKTGWVHTPPISDISDRCLGEAVPESKPIPRVVISSPAYQMDEIPSDADEAAQKYVRDHALPQWVLDHLANMWNAGFTAGGAR